MSLDALRLCFPFYVFLWFFLDIQFFQTMRWFSCTDCGRGRYRGERPQANAQSSYYILDKSRQSERHVMKDLGKSVCSRTAETSPMFAKNEEIVGEKKHETNSRMYNGKFEIRARSYGLDSIDLIENVSKDEKEPLWKNQTIRKCRTKNSVNSKTGQRTAFCTDRGERFPTST